MNAEVNRFDGDYYNRLPMLDDATRRLIRVRRDFDRFTRDATALLADTEFCNGEIGALLLHRHWPVRAGQIMVERPTTLKDGTTALRTASMSATRAMKVAATPSRWAAPEPDSWIVPLEFSTDPSVARVNERLSSSQTILQSLGDLLRRYGLEKIVGFMIVPRQTLRQASNCDYVETNEQNVSIITAEHLSASDRQSHVRTGWSLAPKTKVRKGRRRPQGYCIHTPDYNCHHTPPVCKPHGCVKPDPRNPPDARKPKRPSKKRPSKK